MLKMLSENKECDLSQIHRRLYIIKKMNSLHQRKNSQTMIQLVVDIIQRCRLETLSHLTFSNLYEAIHIKIFTSI